MKSNKDIELREKADEIYPKLQSEIELLVYLIKEELKRQKELLKN